MTQNLKIVVIDDDDNRRQNFKIILEFLGEEVLASDSAHWKTNIAKHLTDASEIAAVFLGCCQSSHLQQMVTVVDHWINNLPLLLLCQEVPENVLKQNVLTKLDTPPSYNQLIDALHRAQVYREQTALNRSRGEKREVELFRSLVGTSRKIQKVRELIMQVADKNVSVLIQGESGTGKEVVARNLHYHSDRRDKPFVPINCGAIPAELLESELFGHEKGAFTGAISSRPGRFELAEGGTLFLDEIGDMPLNMQVKILRVLQEHTFERVGSNKTIKANVRIVAATHKNLEEMIEEGTFREDLFYRLNVFPIDVPALRERVEDLPLLINELVSRLEHEKRGSIRFNSAAIMSLCNHAWPGNVRELANLVERLAILYPHGVVGVGELPKKFRYLDENEQPEISAHLQDVTQVENGLAGIDMPALLPVNGLDLKEYLQELESSLIQQALDDSNGVVARAAEKLNIRRTTLVEKMRKYGLGKHETTA